MTITVQGGLEGASAARGVVVVIDVFRATTTMACLLTTGVARIILVDSPAAFAPFRGRPDHVFFSELSPEGYDNSPLVALRTPTLRGMTAVMATASGTPCIRAAMAGADRVLTACFANLDSVVCLLRSLAPEHVTLVPAGLVPAACGTIEDDLCAATLAARLRGERVDEGDLRRRLRDAVAARELNPARPSDLPVLADLLFASSTGLLDVVPEAIRSAGGELRVGPAPS